MGLKRSLNREMKKLGYTPIKNRAFRNPRVLVMAWGGGETEIGLFNIDATEKRWEQLPMYNRTAFTQNLYFDARELAALLLERSAVGMKGQDDGQH